MATNPYFQNGRGVGVASEQDLYEDNIIEMIQMAGMDVFYIPRVLFNPDDFYREAPNAKYENYIPIEMYMKNTGGWEGQGEMYSKFGFDLDFQIQMLVSRRRFQEELGKIAPDEGDLIWLPLQRVMFEIDNVIDEPTDHFYALSKAYTFQINCSTFVYSYEDFDTGIKRVDVDFNEEEFQTPFDRTELIDEETDEIIDLTEDNLFGPIKD